MISKSLFKCKKSCILPSAKYPLNLKPAQHRDQTVHPCSTSTQDSAPFPLSLFLSVPNHPQALKAPHIQTTSAHPAHPGSSPGLLPSLCPGTVTTATLAMPAAFLNTLPFLCSSSRYSPHFSACCPGFSSCAKKPGPHSCFSKFHFFFSSLFPELTSVLLSCN